MGFLGILFVGAGCFMVVRPEWFYDMTERWKNSGGEPSPRYVFHTRLWGAITMVVGAASIIGQFILN